MARMRRIKGTPELLAASTLTINQPHALHGKWQSIYKQSGPLVLEVGCGRGRFLYEAAQIHPENNYLGLDVIPEILMEAIERYSKRVDFPENIRFLWLDAEHLDEIFDLGEVQEIYLHFSDPWPKKRHAKRRLTHHNYLAIYEHILPPDGKVIFKTDSLDFFLFSVEEFQEAGWRIISQTEDLYSLNDPSNIATEYERRFVNNGKSICRLIALPPIKEASR